MLLTTDEVDDKAARFAYERAMKRFLSLFGGILMRPSVGEVELGIIDWNRFDWRIDSNRFGMANRKPAGFD